MKGLARGSAALAVMLMVAACHRPPRPVETSYAAPPPAAPPPASAAAPAAPLVRSSFGSGILVDGQGDVVTSASWLKACTSLYVVDSDGRRETATSADNDTRNDLELLRTGLRRPAGAVFEDDSKVQRPGASIVVTGYQLTPALLGDDMRVTPGSLTAQQGVRGDQRLIEISAPLQLGDGGGPVFDENGRVIGLLAFLIRNQPNKGVLLQNISFAVKTSVIRTFLHRSKIAYAHAGDERRMSTGDVGEAAKAVTVRVECVGPAPTVTAAAAAASPPAAVRVTPIRPASAAVPSAPEVRGAISGQRAKLAYWWDLARDCASLGAPKVVVIEKPAHGEVTFEPGQDYPNFAKDNPRFACNTAKVPVTQMFYKSQGSFNGTDTFSVDEVNGEGQFRHIAYTVNVR